MPSSMFWKNKAPAEFSQTEWESLCDNCGKCCLHKYEDIDSAEVYYTSVSCRYLDTESCHCTDYANRSSNVPDCINLTPKELEDPYWLPSTCAYKLIAQNNDLPKWHPLLTGNPDSTRETGNSISGLATSENDADNPENFYIDWITP